MLIHFGSELLQTHHLNYFSSEMFQHVDENCHFDAFASEVFKNAPSTVILKHSGSEILHYLIVSTRALGRAHCRHYHPPATTAPPAALHWGPSAALRPGFMFVHITGSQEKEKVHNKHTRLAE